MTSDKDFSFGPLDETCINTLRFLAVDGVEKAASGHPGMPMGDAAMAYVLWTRFLRFNPRSPGWHGRDRFVLSAGHGSMLLYSLLHVTGYNMPLEELKNFRQWGSNTPGHPEHEIARGIETTTGPLGQGFANGVGMAMAQKYLAERYNKPGFPLFDYNIYAITSDGDMMEGVSNEAASIAGHLGLGSIVYLYSDNKITIEGSTDVAFTEDVGKRLEALKWHVQKVDGNDLVGLAKALAAAKAETTRPSVIMARTHIGFGSPGKQDSAEAHGAPLGKDEVKAAKAKLNWKHTEEFFVPDEARKAFSGVAEAGTKLNKDWDTLLASYEKAHPELAAELKIVLSGNRDTGWEAALPKFAATDTPVATRTISGKVLNAIASKAPFLIGGSADLSPSNNTYIKGFDDYTSQKSGRNLHFGVREHAMGSLMNGIALTGGLVPYGGTFLIFADYMRPPMRLAALMGIQAIYVLTHDSIGLGEDGPTHQPIEQLSNLRGVPNMTVIRPADATETVDAWRAALKRATGPTVLALTRQNLPMIDREKLGSKGDLTKGAYIVADAKNNAPELIIIATGSEVSLGLDAYHELTKRGVKARLVSMPCTEFFDAQDSSYKESVLPSSVRARISIEAGVSAGWHRYVGLDGDTVSLDRFGASAPYKTLFEKFGFTVDKVVERSLKLLKKS